MSKNTHLFKSMHYLLNAMEAMEAGKLQKSKNHLLEMKLELKSESKIPDRYLWRGVDFILVNMDKLPYTAFIQLHNLTKLQCSVVLKRTMKDTVNQVAGVTGFMQAEEVPEFLR